MIRWRGRFSPFSEEDYLEESQEDLVNMEGYCVKVSGLFESGPAVEVHNLFRRLYGEPQECGPPNPYVAKYRRLRASVIPHLENSQDYDYTTGSIEYRYWPDLKLSYIENVYVSAEMRRKGFGVKLINFAVNYLRHQGSQRIYGFSVNPVGFRLLASAGFISEPPENPAYRWRRWFSYNIDQIN